MGQGLFILSSCQSSFSCRWARSPVDVRATWRRWSHSRFPSVGIRASSSRPPFHRRNPIHCQSPIRTRLPLNRRSIAPVR